MVSPCVIRKRFRKFKNALKTGAGPILILLITTLEKVYLYHNFQLWDDNKILTKIHAHHRSPVAKHFFKIWCTSMDYGKLGPCPWTRIKWVWIWRNRIFSCEEAALEVQMPVCLCVCLSVCLSVWPQNWILPRLGCLKCTQNQLTVQGYTKPV